MSELQIYNSLTKQKEPFTPITPNKIRLYVCGVTVYDYCHIGHARTYLAFDVIIRFLRSQGYEVTYVRNITDIDDKIIQRAQTNGESPDDLVARFIKVMYEDFDALNILRPDHEPRATQTIPEMLQMIQVLIDKGFAYAADNGDVYYRVARFKAYGKLSGQHVDQLRCGERVEVNEDKEDPLDFVLWKAAKPDEPSWDSPWGAGRPGWHLECSCMTKKVLGEHFDIHGGGSDLRFPHHENEIAQSEAANDGPYANYWVHSGMVQVNTEKMSKSLGNFFVIRDVLAQYPAEVVRYFLISGHYRSEINYSDDNLQQAWNALRRLYTALRDAPEHGAQLMPEYIERFNTVMLDDFNTPEALAILFDLAREANRAKDQGALQQVASLALTLKHLGGLLGVLQLDPACFLQAGQGVDADAVEALIAQRNAARAAQDWTQADAIREQLTAMGVVLEDRNGQTVWKIGL
jgi:cysteinyl-tRNA synthetase